jgi:glycosidase
MVWDDLAYDDRHPFGPEYPVKVGVDKEILALYQELGKLRKEQESLRRGNYKTIHVDDKKGLFAFQRAMNQQERIRVVFNLSKEPQEVDAVRRYLLPLDPYKVPDGKKPLEWELILGDSGDLNVLPPKSARVYKFIYKPENEPLMTIPEF